MFGRRFRLGGGAIFFVIVAAMLAILFLLPPYGRPLVWLAPPAFVASLLLLIAGTKWFFFDPRSLEEVEKNGLLETINYRAQRAFQVEEYEDEGSHYFLELEDGSVLYLNGQYLCEYEPLNDDPELNQPRQFPCTEFAIRRHKKKGYAVDILCSGTVIEPEITAPPFDREAYRRKAVPEDGQIIRNRTYAQLKTERLQNARR
jgi:hypothetical protein